jgi:hypothetical protein
MCTHPGHVSVTRGMCCSNIPYVIWAAPQLVLQPFPLQLLLLLLLLVGTYAAALAAAGWVAAAEPLLLVRPCYHSSCCCGRSY